MGQHHFTDALCHHLAVGSVTQSNITDHIFKAIQAVNGDPVDYPESQQQPDRREWQEATDKEWRAMDDYEVYDWVDEHACLRELKSSQLDSFTRKN